MKKLCNSRILSLVLMVVMVFGMLPEYVHAAPDNTVPTVNVSTWEELAAAMEEDSTTNIVVTRDIVFNEARTKKHPYDNGVYYNGNDYVVEVKGNHTVDLNGKKVDIRTDKDTSSKSHLYYYEDINRDYYIGRTIYLFHVYDGAAVTMKDSSEKQTGSLRFHAYIEEWDLGEIRGAYASKKDGSYQEYRYSDRDSERVLFSVYNGSLTFESGKYIAGRSKQQWVSWAVKHQEDNIYTGLIDDYHGYAYHLIGGGISASVNSDITVLGGEFEGRRADLFRILGGSLTINDGYFDNRCLGTIIKNVKDAEVNVYGGKFRGGTYDWFLNDEQKSREEVEEGYTTDSQPVARYVDWELYNVKHNGKTYTNKGDYFHAVEYNSKVKSVITEEVVPKNQTEVSKELSDAVISFIPSGEETLEGSVQSDAISFYPGQKGLIQTNMEEIRYFAADADAELTGEWSIRFAKKGTEEQYEEPVSCSVPGDASFELDSYMTVNKAPFKLNEMEPGSKAILQVTLTETLGKVKIVHRGEAELAVLNEEPIQNAQLGMKDTSDKYTGILLTGTELDDYSVCPYQRTVAVYGDKWIDMTTKVAAVGEVVNGKRYSKLIAVSAAPGYYLDNTFTLSSPYTDWKIVPIRFDERTYHKTAYYQIIVPTENGPISAMSLGLPDAAYQDGHLVPGTVIQNLQFSPYLGQTTVEVQFWTENGKEAANSEIVKGLHSYRAMLKLTCGAEEIFDPELVVEVENRKCEVLGISENGMEAYVYTPVLTANCEHVGPEWIREETEHWKNCIYCGEQFDRDEHHWVVVSSMRNLELWKCAECGVQTRLVKDAVELKKIVVDIPHPTAGELITPVTIAPQFEGMARVVASTWYKGESKQPITLGTARFEKGVNYYVTVQVKTDYGYALCADSSQTVLTNSGVYVKSTDFGSGDQFQIYDAYAGNIQAQFHCISMEKTNAELTLPASKVGMTYEELIKGIKLTNSAGHLVTIRKNGVEDACASVLPLSDTMTVVAFKDGYNNKGNATLKIGNVYTVVIEVTLTNGAILAKNVKTVNQGNAGNIVITDGVSGPVIMATYAMAEATDRIDYAALTITPPMAGEYPANAVSSSSDYSVATQWIPGAKTGFEAGKSYQVLLTLTAAQDHTFSDDIIVMVNGRPAEVTSSGSGEEIYVLMVLTVPAAKPEKLQGFRFTVDEPVAGDRISDSQMRGISKIGSEGSCATMDSAWSPAEGNFEAGKNYTFSIIMRAKENSIFAEDAVFSLNGAENLFTVVSGLGTDTVKLEYTFPSLFGIITQPRDVTVVNGQKASYTVKAYGENLSYQWQYLMTGSSIWKNSTLASAKTATYSFTASSSHNGMKARCVITDKNGKTVTTKEVLTTVTAAGPVIKTQPENVAIEAGKTATFTVAATGEGLTYQWKKSVDGGETWVNSSSTGAKTGTLNMTTKASYNGLRFKCIVTDKNGKFVVSNVAKLTIVTESAGPVITSQPANVSVAEGAAVTFKTAATGDSLTYQWKKSTDGGKNWVNSSSTGAKTNTLTMTAKASFNGYQFKCVVTDQNGKVVESNAAKLTVTAAGTNTSAITSQPANASAAEGATVTFKIAATGEGLTYQWKKSTDGGKNWVNSSSTGAKTNTLTMTAKASFNSYQFKCVVTDQNGKVVESKAATLTVYAAGTLAITSQPANVTVAAGATATFKVAATGEGLTYQWKKSTDGGKNWVNSSSTGAKTDTLIMTTKASYNGLQFKCVVTDQNGKVVESKAATLTVK